MSEFKFACPVCGQHITCDSGSSGAQMDCPTCFRKLVVPQAPAPGAKSFVLTAAEVQMRPVPLAGKGGPSGAAVDVKPKQTPGWLVGVGVVLFVGGLAAAVFFFIKGGKTPSKLSPEETSGLKAPATNPSAGLISPASVATATNWTLNLAEVSLPDSPASGAVHGQRFQLQRAVIQGGKLDLRQGSKWPPDLGFSIHLFAERAQDLAGKTVVLEASRTNAPRVVLRWKDEWDKPVTTDFKKGYLARLEFGKVTSNRLEGKIYLAVPDENRSYAAGTFNAEIREPKPKK